MVRGIGGIIECGVGPGRERVDSLHLHVSSSGTMVMVWFIFTKLPVIEKVCRKLDFQ